MEGGTARQAAFKGSADFRTDASEKFTAGINAGGFPVQLGDQLSKAGINGFYGNTAFALNVTGQNDGGFSAAGDVKISDARLLEPKGTLAVAAADAVRQAGVINLGLQFIHHTDNKDEFKITTNIAALITQALRRTAEAYAQRAMAEIERALRAKIDEYIGGRLSNEQIDTLLKAAKGEADAINSIKGALDQKRNEFENRIKAAADQAVEQAKEEAGRQAGQAIQDLKEGQTPSLSLPSLPSGGGLRLPGR